MLTDVIEAITAQQPKEENAVWMVGEQLKDMVRREPQLAEIVLRDLDVPEMSLANCEKKIKAWADQHKVGNFACVTPIRAEKIIREFYKVNAAEGGREGGLGHKVNAAEGGREGGLGHGLPERGAEPADRPDTGGKFIDLTDFF